MKRLELTSAVKDEFNPDTAIYPLMGFRKVDGVRAGHLHGYFHGRSLDPFANRALNARFAAPHVYAGFDGELTIGGALTDIALKAMIEGGRLIVDDPESSLCSLTTGLTNRAKVKKGETALPEDAVWNLFDLLSEGVIDLPYEDRYNALVRRVQVEKPEHVRVLPFVWIRDAEEARAWIIECLELTFEGAIFRDPKAKHKSGRATAKMNDFWRYKPVSDKDAVVVGVEPAMANGNAAVTNTRGRTERSAHAENKTAKEEVGVLLCYEIEKDRVIRVAPGAMKKAFCAKAWSEKGLVVGHPIKYTSLDVGVKDQPRQARFKEFRSWADLEKLTPEQAARVTGLIEEYAR